MSDETRSSCVTVSLTLAILAATTRLLLALLKSIIARVFNFNACDANAVRANLFDIAEPKFLAASSALLRNCSAPAAMFGLLSASSLICASCTCISVAAVNASLSALICAFLNPQAANWSPPCASCWPCLSFAKPGAIIAPAFNCAVKNRPRPCVGIAALL